MPKSSPELDQAVNACVDPNELRRILKEGLAKEGVILPQPDGELGAARNPDYVDASAPAPIVQQPTDPSQHKCIRVVYPYQNARVEISGMTEQQLDEIERRVRASFGQ